MTAGTDNPIGTDEPFLILRDDKCLAHSLQLADEGKRSYVSSIDDHAYVAMIRLLTSMKKKSRAHTSFLTADI